MIAASQYRDHTVTSTDSQPGTVSQTVLDNVGWHAIQGPHRALSEVLGNAGRYHLDVAPFAAISDTTAPDAWADLGRLMDGHAAVLFRPGIEVPDGWKTEHQLLCYQLVAGDLAEPRVDIELVDLGPQDVPEMLELVAATQPGPFSERTIELGSYIGHRSGGRLVAMAGERMRPPGFTEVSAVCTAADQRGRGLGGALTLAVADHIRERGDEAFLHVAADNTTALNLYLTLGFVVRCEVDVVIVREER
jgi:ribosomal protein S18 acetylase RimI-like enzyme